MFDGAFRIIRFNPKATVGSSVIVAAVTMAIPVLVTAILTATVNVTFDRTGTPDDEALVGIAGSYGSLVVGLVLFAFGSLFVTAMVAHVVSAAAIGRRLTLGQAWAATRGKRWKLVVLTMLLGLVMTTPVTIYVVAWVVVVIYASSVAVVVVWAVLTIPLFVAVWCVLWVRVNYLPVPVLMLEDVGVFGAIARSWRLTRKQFWRIGWIAFVTTLVAMVASSVLAGPFGVVGQLALFSGSRYALLIYVVSQAVSQVVSAAFVTPFTSGVTSLQYLDQRMRKEAYDVELMSQAGLTG
jgi:hypothetical protein